MRTELCGPCEHRLQQGSVSFPVSLKKVEGWEFKGDSFEKNSLILLISLTMCVINGLQPSEKHFSMLKFSFKGCFKIIFGINSMEGGRYPIISPIQFSYLAITRKLTMKFIR